MKKVYSYYVLDILHKGHIAQMRNSKIIAGKDGLSIVGILTDEATMKKKPHPIISFAERLDIARAIKYVDIVVPQETYSPLPNLKRLKPNVAMESSSHDEKEMEEIKKFMKSIGGEIITLTYYPPQSSTKIKKEIKEKWKKEKE